MWAVAGGILLAIFILLVLSGLWLTVRDVARFAGRNAKSLAPAAAMIPGAVTLALVVGLVGAVGYAATRRAEPKFVEKPLPYMSYFNHPVR